MLLKLDEITLIEGNHAREKINQKQVSHYALLMKDGAIFPPVVVFGEENILGDGWHRFFANRLNKKTEIMAERKEGGAREARLYSYQANHHGLPPTPKERIANARYLLDDSEWSQWPDIKIAAHVGLGRVTIWRMRQGENPKKSVSMKQIKPTKISPSGPADPPEDPIAKAQYLLDDSQMQELSETVTELQAEVVQLQDIISTKRWDASEIEQDDALDTIKELRKQIEILEMENKTLRGARDTYQNRCAELVTINKGLQNKLKKVA